MSMPEQPLSWDQASHPLSEQLARRAEALNAPKTEETMRPSLDQLPGVRDYDLQEGMVYYEDGTQASVKTAFARYAAETAMKRL